MWPTLVSGASGACVRLDGAPRNPRHCGRGEGPPGLQPPPHWCLRPGRGAGSEASRGGAGGKGLQRSGFWGWRQAQSGAGKPGLPFGSMHARRQLARYVAVCGLPARLAIGPRVRCCGAPLWGPGPIPAVPRPADTLGVRGLSAPLSRLGLGRGGSDPALLPVSEALVKSCPTVGLRGRGRGLRGRRARRAALPSRSWSSALGRTGDGDVRGGPT